MSNPKSLAIALNVQRKNRAKTSKIPSPTIKYDEPEDRPGSIAEAIISKRRASQATEESSELEIDTIGKENYDDVDLGSLVEPAPPTDRVDAIRMKLKSLRES